MLINWNLNKNSQENSSEEESIVKLKETLHTPPKKNTRNEWGGKHRSDVSYRKQELWDM